MYAPQTRIKRKCRRSVRSQTSYAGLRLALGGRRAVCRASALPLAGILPPMRLVAAALAFAIVLSLAGVLGKLLLRGNHHTGDCRGACGCLRLAGNWFRGSLSLPHV